MKVCARQYTIIASTLLLLVSGCGLSMNPAPLSQQKTEDAVEEARENFDAIKELPIENRYPDDFQEAQEELLSSEEFLRQKLFDEAYISANNSLGASQRILRNFYQYVVAQSAQRTKSDIQKISDADPDNPLQDFLPKLNEILDYSDSIEEEEDFIALEKVLDDLDRLTQIEHNTKENVTRTIAIDVSFPSGRYELAEEGKQLLRDYVGEIITSRKHFEQLYPESPVTITIKVVGYADQVDFNPGTKLLERLLEQGEEVPSTEPSRRKFLNQGLSELRAKALADHTVKIIDEHASEQGILHIQQDVRGLGEIIPPGVSKPYPLEDPRRRICKIYSYITTP